MTTLLLALLLSPFSHAETPQPCRDAITAAITKDYGPHFKLHDTHFLPVKDENLVEVVSLVYSWVPNSEINSGFYLLVTATCEPAPGVTKPTRLGQLSLWEFGGEGGVQLKTVSKAR